MKKHIGISLFFMECFLSLSATNYFVATNGDCLLYTSDAADE